MRINKRIDKIESELQTFGIDVSKLDDAEDGDDENLLKDINSDDDGESDEMNDIDELSGMSDNKTNYKKNISNKVRKMDTMEEKKNRMSERSSKIMNNYANEDPFEILEKRKKEYINAIEYLKKNNLSKDQKAIFAILEKAEKVKKLMKNDEVDIYEIPGPIVPDEILGISNAEKVKKFQTIINIINKSINNLKIIGGNNFKEYNHTKNKI